MIKEFEHLSNEERKLLYSAPAMVSVFASCSSGSVNTIQKADAIKLAQLKTFTASQLLIPYYIEVEKHFKNQFEFIVNKYQPFTVEKRGCLKKEIDKINLLIRKLDKAYGQALYLSLQRYEKHVKHSSHSIFEYFIFPLPLPGFLD